jgi:Trk K+ transport system NAD-binding subunit
LITRFQKYAFRSISRFLVCGLGSLGQYCVVALKEFGVQVIAIEQQLSPNQDWEITELPTLLEKLIQGDCRHKNILQQAQFDRCRAALLVTNSEKVNTETAIVKNLTFKQFLSFM